MKIITALTDDEFDRASRHVSLLLNATAEYDHALERWVGLDSPAYTVAELAQNFLNLLRDEGNRSVVVLRREGCDCADRVWGEGAVSAARRVLAEADKETQP